VQTPAVAPLTLAPTDITGQLQLIYSRLSDLSIQTQTTIDQLSLTGIDTTNAQTAVDSSKIDLAKAKLTLETETPKYGPKLAESQLEDSRADILKSLAFLTASLPTLDQSGQ